MTKSELIAAMANKSELSKGDAEKALNSFLGTVTETLAKGEKLALVGFGSFEISERAARTGQNPRTGEPLEIAACKVPKFKAGKALKDAVNR